jgi:hypothetical protein
MAGLADLFSGAAQAVGAYDPMLTPEANAMVGAKPPMAAAPVTQQPTFQRPKGLRGAVGTVFDILAAMGGQETGTDLARKDFEARQAGELAMQKQNVLGAYLADPSNPDLQKQAFQVAPLETFEIVTKLTPKPQPISKSGEIQLYELLTSKGASHEEAVNAILFNRSKVVRGEKDNFALGPDGKPVALGTGVPQPAPPPPQFSFIQGTDAQGNPVILSGNARTGDAAPTGFGAPPKGTGGGTQNNPSGGGNIAKLDVMIQNLEEVERTLRGGKANVSGPVLGALPEVARPFVAPQAVDIEERVAGVTQGTLKETLGAQFAQKEGEGFIKRGYNPSLDEAVNARRVAGQIKILKAKRAELAGGRPGAPAVGTVMQGYRYKGGDPAQRSSWEAVK